MFVVKNFNCNIEEAHNVNDFYLTLHQIYQTHESIIEEKYLEIKKNLKV